MPLEGGVKLRAPPSSSTMSVLLFLGLCYVIAIKKQSHSHSKGRLKLSGTRLGTVRQLKFTSQLVLDSLGSGGEELSRPPTAATGAVSHQLFQMVL